MDKMLRRVTRDSHFLLEERVRYKKRHCKVDVNLLAELCPREPRKQLMYIKGAPVKIQKKWKTIKTVHMPVWDELMDKMGAVVDDTASEIIRATTKVLRDM